MDHGGKVAASEMVDESLSQAHQRPFLGKGQGRGGLSSVHLGKGRGMMR